jgi:hypothetical protein
VGEAEERREAEDGVVCASVADKVLADFWVTIILPNNKYTISNVISCYFLFICAYIWHNCRVTIGSRRGRRRRPRRTSRKSARDY